ncbi:hypothetical protein [Actinokineospora bangkokensis]|uniref:hypothetical protein n=1 Tax=Actinokineospora bangkokensis TaxID=1193682 RepID=UPI001178B1AF|nr:hypothetical protein [Actinokineospora bangkokensis]
MAAVGVAVAAGAVVLVIQVGLERSDQVASVVGAAAGVVGLLVTVVGAVRANAARHDPPLPAPGVRQTVRGSRVGGSVIQVGGDWSGSLPPSSGTRPAGPGDDTR